MIRPKLALQSLATRLSCLVVGQLFCECYRGHFLTMICFPGHDPLLTLYLSCLPYKSCDLDRIIWSWPVQFTCWTIPHTSRSYYLASDCLAWKHEHWSAWSSRRGLSLDWFRWHNVSVGCREPMMIRQFISLDGCCWWFNQHSRRVV